MHKMVYNNFASKRMIIFLVMLMAPLVGAGIDLYTPSLPAISNYFNSSDVLVRYTMITYLLGYGVGQIFYGPISDSVGRRVVLIVGLIFYVITSVISALSPSIMFLLSMRLLQGLAIASVSVLTKAILADSFSGNSLTKASAMMTFAWALGPILAPAIGGYVQHYAGWRVNFLFLAGYGALALGLIIFLLPETNQKRKNLELDNVLSNFKEILTNEVFIGAVLCMALSYSLLTVFNVIAPFLIQDILKYTPVDYGHMALLMGLAYFLGTMINRIIVHKVTSYQLIKISLTYMIIVASIMVLMSYFLMNLFTIVVPTFVLLFGSAFILPNCMAISLGAFPKMAGAASAVIGFLLMVGTGIITAIASLLKTNTQMPLSITYLILVALCFAVYFFLLKKSHVE